mmetsp:Transcript_81922/g.219139  ORF Transcript_81922/g.219139 Transcript_81922/m.219139 type:complete len:756 (+) Transcript_81922:83-2350(+)
MRAFTVTAAAALQVDVSSHEQSPLGALQAQFAAVEQQIKTAGRITPGVYSTVQKLQKMVTSIIEPAILESHAADQLLVLTVFREIISCDATYQKFLKGDKMAALAALKGVKTEFDHCGGSVEELKEKFAKCMDDRDVLVRHNNTVCCQEFAICSSPTGYGDCETACPYWTGVAALDPRTWPPWVGGRRAVRALALPSELIPARRRWTPSPACAEVLLGPPLPAGRCRWLALRRNQLAHALNGNGSGAGPAADWCLMVDEWVLPVLASEVVQSQAWPGLVGVALVPGSVWLNLVDRHRDGEHGPTIQPLGFACIVSDLKGPDRRLLSADEVTIVAATLVRKRGDGQHGRRVMRLAVYHVGAGDVAPQQAHGQQTASSIFQFECRSQWTDAATWTSWEPQTPDQVRQRIVNTFGPHGVLDVWGFWRLADSIGGKTRATGDGAALLAANGQEGVLFKPERAPGDPDQRPVLWIEGDRSVDSYLKDVAAEPDFGGITYCRHGPGILIQQAPSRWPWTGQLQHRGLTIRQGGGQAFVTTGWDVSTLPEAAVAYLRDSAGWPLAVTPIRRRVVGRDPLVVEISLLADGPPEAEQLSCAGRPIRVDLYDTPVARRSNKNSWELQQSNSREPKNGPGPATGPKRGVDRVAADVPPALLSRIAKLESARTAPSSTASGATGSDVAERLESLEKRLDQQMKDTKRLGESVEQRLAPLETHMTMSTNRFDGLDNKLDLLLEKMGIKKQDAPEACIPVSAPGDVPMS